MRLVDCESGFVVARVIGGDGLTIDQILDWFGLGVSTFDDQILDESDYPLPAWYGNLVLEDD